MHKFNKGEVIKDKHNGDEFLILSVEWYISYDKEGWTYNIKNLGGVTGFGLAYKVWSDSYDLSCQSVRTNRLNRLDRLV